MTTPATLATKLENIIDLHAVQHRTTKFSYPFTSDGRPARFWEICCFVADRKNTAISDINRSFYGSMKSDWHSVILYLCNVGLLSRRDGVIRPGHKLEQYRRTIIAEINE
jgi:hypothetical protein